MFIKDKLTKGALKLDTSKYVDKDDIGIKPPSRSQYQNFRGFHDKSYIEFGGTDEYLEGTTRDFAFGTGDFTLAFWVYMSGTSAFPMGRYADADNWWFYQVGWTGTTFLGFFDTEIGGTGNAGGTMLSFRSGVAQNAWHHVVLTQDRNGSFTEYVDGSSVATYINNAGGASDLNVAAPTHIGRYNTTYSGNGIRLADIRWYDTLVNSKQATRLYDESLSLGEDAAGLKSNLQDWYTFGQKYSKIYGSEFDYMKTNIGGEKFGFENRALKDKANSLDFRHPSNSKELVSNGTFASNLTGWDDDSGGWVQGSGTARSFTNNKDLTLGVQAKLGRTYDITYTVDMLGATGYSVPYLGSRQLSMIISGFPATSTSTVRAVADGDFKFTSVVALETGSNGTSLDNISLKEYSTRGLVPKNMEASDLKKIRTKGGKIV